MVDGIGAGWTWAVVGLALASVLSLFGRRRKTDAELLFAVFCGSLAMSLLRPGFADAPIAVQALLAVGACFTCNGYWLVARALFRGEGGVAPRHLAVALGIAALIVLHRAAAAGGGSGMAVLGGFLSLASSTVLVLACLEALRGWDRQSRDERRLRAAYMLVYGACVLAVTGSAAMAGADPRWASIERGVVLAAATLMMVFTHGALVVRRRASDTPAPPAAEDQALAAAILRALEQDALYREPELKVGDLATAVGSAEHKVSRVITRVLGERNFNQLVNRHRIRHACALLESGGRRTVLEVSLESGFASLGPFNRAFKQATGCTPTEWRSRRRAAA